jgi:hypothetical protein
MFDLLDPSTVNLHNIEVLGAIAPALAAVLPSLLGFFGGLFGGGGSGGGDAAGGLDGLDPELRDLLLTTIRREAIKSQSMDPMFAATMGGIYEMLPNFAKQNPLAMPGYVSQAGPAPNRPPNPNTPGQRPNPGAGDPVLGGPGDPNPRSPVPNPRDPTSPGGDKYPTVPKDAPIDPRTGLPGRPTPWTSPRPSGLMPIEDALRILEGQGLSYPRMR